MPANDKDHPTSMRWRFALPALIVVVGGLTVGAAVVGRSLRDGAPTGGRGAMTALARLAGQVGTDSGPPPPGKVPPAIGMNIAALRWYNTSVPFTNLARGHEWVGADWKPLAPELQDNDGTLLELKPGQAAQRFLSMPTQAPEGYRVTCTYTGSGMVTPGAATLVSAGPGRITFAVPKLGKPRGTPWVTVKGVQRGKPFGNLDCRGSESRPQDRFRPEFLRTVQGYKVLRFMDWQMANANSPITWATRHTPRGIRLDQDGVAIEDMLALIEITGADPWFCMPWNADDAYVAQFAAMVRDRLPAGRNVYVELGNEVWNTSFPVAKQAQQEGLAEGLATNPTEAGQRRYAEKLSQVMAIWEKAFAGRKGLVRVAATQHVVPQRSEMVLSFRDTASHVDALATAPYFGSMIGGVNLVEGPILERLTRELDQTIAQANEQRRVAQKYGKRYISYEGGQGLALPGDQPLLRQIENSEAMYRLYKRYLGWWKRDNGDLLMLYTSVLPISAGGAWGHSEYESDGPEQSAKLRAVLEER